MTLQPITLNIIWSGPYKVLDSFDINWAENNNFEWPGVYLHVIKDFGGSICGLYAGRHTQSVIYRQHEHKKNYDDGKYHLFNAQGQVVHQAGQAKGTDYQNLLNDHVALTEVFFGRADPAGKFNSEGWAPHIEGMLLESPNWIAQGQNTLNQRKGANDYKMFNQFIINNTGASEPVAIFGTTVTWDKKTQKIT